MNSRNINIDLLKFILSFLIVGLHAGAFVEYGDNINYMFSSGVFRIAVPVFFLISGYYFSRNNTKGKIIMWSKRVLALFLFWNAFFIFVYIANSPFEIKKILIYTLVGYHHLWYVQAMVIAGVLLFFSKYVINLNDNRLLIISFSLYLLGAVLQYILRFDLFDLNISNANSVHLIYRNALFFGFPFFCLGYYVKSNNIISIPYYWFLISFVLFVVEVGVCICYMIPLRGIEMHLALYPLSAIIFVHVKNAKSMRLKLDNIDIGKISASIFFIHPLFITIGKSISMVGMNLFLFSLFTSLLVSSFIIIPIQKKFLSFIL